MADPFVAEVRIFGFTFAPSGWAHCDGQLLPISQNTALFSLVGTYYGGDGKSTFALPNLQGRLPMHWNQGPGLAIHDLGESAGADSVTLTQAQMPAHTHTLMAGNAAPQQSPAGGAPGTSPARPYLQDPADTTASASFLLAAGGAQPHNNLPPYNTFNFCIALQGVFPARP